MSKIENQLYYREEFRGVYKIPHTQRSNGHPSRSSCSTGITFSHPQVSATGPKFSVLCHMATGSLVSHHGLRKYWHFAFYEIKFYLIHISKKGKRREGAKSFFSKTTD